MFRQSTWRERALDFARPLPLWQRLAFLGYASHRRNGHATFTKGELVALLGGAAASANKGEPGERQIFRAMADAKEYGWLDDRSSLRCLIVPAESVSMGLGHVNDPCAYCEGKRAGRRH